MNLPNKITILRILLIPIMVLFYFLPLGHNINIIIASVIFMIAATTDYVDGKLARLRSEVTDLGKFLDPIADKVLVVVALFIIVEANIMPIMVGSILSGIIIARELMIGALRQVAATRGKVLAADKLGKLKTVLTDTAIPLLILSPLDNLRILYYIGYIIFIIAVAMTVISGLNYLYKHRELLMIYDNKS